jgi:integrase
MSKYKSYITKVEKKKPFTYTFTIELGRDETGKRKRIIKRNFKKRYEAEEALEKALAELEKENSNASNKDMTLGEYLDYWLETYAQSNTAYNTYKGYERMIRVHLKPSLGHVLLSQLNVRVIQDYYTKKVLGYTKDGVKYEALSNQTVKHHHRLLSKCLNDAVDWEFVKVNVAKKAKAPEPLKVTITTYSVQELKKLYEAAKSSEIYYPIIFVGANTGARLGELRALTWEDIDFKTNKIYITKSAYDKKGEGVQIKQTTKNGRSRGIVMGRKLHEFLKSQKLEYLKKKKILGEEFNPKELVFTNTKGNYLDVRDLGRAYKKAIKEARLKDTSYHNLRHSHATILLQKNVHPKVVSERLGHSNIHITLDIYSHVIPSLQDEAAETFDDEFDDDAEE